MRFGVRVAASQFSVAHSQLKPGEDLPVQVDIKFTFKISSLPHGARFQDLVSWLRQLGWKARPLHQLGVQQWLVGADAPPPSGLHAFNSSPVLIQPATQRAPQRPVVHAGRAASSSLSAASPPEVTPAPDPWAAYLQAKHKHAGEGEPPILS